MRSRPAFAAIVITAASLTLGAGAAAAQVAVPENSFPYAAASEPRPVGAPGPIATAVAATGGLWTSPAPPGNGGRKGALIGAAVGAGAAAAVTYWAAATYGENEGGRFCTGCFMQWGAASIPVGALVGALVGHALGGSSGAPQYAPRTPRTFIAPAIGRRGGAVTVAVRY
jgi:hypothetical protein